MAILVQVLCILVLFNAANAAKKQYVEPQSVVCSATDISFSLSRDASKSDLFAETQLNVDIYTGNHFQLVKDFNTVNGDVKIGYKNYSIVATVAYGHNQRPLLYNIEQPFIAVPRTAVPSHNFTFGVYCSIPASYDVNITANETDSESGDEPGEIVHPTDHIDAKLAGLRRDGSSVLGDQLSYSILLKDETYAAVVPSNCKYYDPNNDDFKMPFVLDKCPQLLPNDPSAEFYSKIEKKDDREYQLHFKSFAFEATANTFLGIDCDILLCIEQNLDECNQPCWGVPGTATPASERPTQPTTLKTTQGPVTTEVAIEVTVPPVTSPKPITAGPTTHQVTIPPTTAPVPTTAAPSTDWTSIPASTAVHPSTAEVTTAPPHSTEHPITPAVSTELPPTKAPVPPPRLIRLKVTQAPSQMKLQGDGEPTSTIINDKMRFKVTIPGASPLTPGQQAIDNDVQVLNALYGVIGGLAVLVAVLVLGLVCFLRGGHRRRNKVQHQNAPMYFPGSIYGRPY